jgi:acyl phosphate:glycerol-3-phosphate acyltransferase
VAALSVSTPVVVLAIVLSYALGCIPGARIVAGRHGVDLRRTGDGNPGAWNALEQLGWARAWPAFALDGAKGAAAALIGWVAISDWPWADDGGLLRAGGAMAEPAAGHWLPWACVAAAMLGHAFPAERWRIGAGGKSVMTFAGGAIALVPAIGLPLIAVFIGAILLGRAAACARLAVFAFPFGQALVTPLVQVGWTGLLMTTIGLLFLVRRGPRAARAG